MSVLGVYNPFDIEIDHGDGVYLYSSQGTRYLDFTSGIGVTCLGHSHPALVNAIKELLQNSLRLETMAKKSRKAGNRAAAKMVAEVMLKEAK